MLNMSIRQMLIVAFVTQISAVDLRLVAPVFAADWTWWFHIESNGVKICMGGIKTVGTYLKVWILCLNREKIL